MTRSDPGTGSSSASDDEVYLATSAIQLHELLMRRSDDSLETVEQNALEALLSDPEVVSRYNAEVKAVMSELFGADRERWPAFRSDVTALPATKLTVVHEAPVGDEGAVSVLREGHGEDVEGFVFVERNDDAAWVVLHENLGLHFEKAGVDVHDQSLPTLVAEQLTRTLGPAWQAAVTWSPLDDSFFQDLQIHVSPRMPLTSDRSDLEVAHALLPAMEALYAAVDPGDRSYVFGGVALQQQRTQVDDPKPTTWESVPTVSRHAPRSPLGSATPPAPTFRP